MSSHREAPQISKDPNADSTDVYAFVSPDQPDSVTLISNYIPLQLPDGGPNFYEFADDVLYSIKIDNDGDGKANIAYEFRFTTVNTIPSSFLYNDGPITSLTGQGAALWNRKQTYTVTRQDYSSNGGATVLASNLTAPPCNIGPLSTPHYAKLAGMGVYPFSAGGYSGNVFAGQRAEGFYVDLGSVFDLGGLRPFESDHLSGMLKNMPGVNSTANVNVHTLALQVPITDLTMSGAKPSSTTARDAVIGVWTTAERQTVTMRNTNAPGSLQESGPYTQVSRLGSPLVNELLIGIAYKDMWNASHPIQDGTQFFSYFANPLLGQLLPSLYPGVFPNLASYNSSHTGTTAANPARPDIAAILLTGIPESVLAGAGLGGAVPPTNVGGKGVAEMLRLNVAQAPTASGDENIFGYLEGDPAGFPNGRRVFDDVATIELRAIAGATLPLVDPGFTPDGAVGTVGTDPNTVISFGLTNGNDPTAKGTESYLSTFPYLGTPYSGYLTPSKTPTDKGV